MTQPDKPARRSPRRRSTARTDSTHPAPARPGGSRGGARRPWPTAPTTTHVSPGKPATGTGRSRSRGPASAPTPASVWTAGTASIDLGATWPAALVERIVTSFSKPTEQVVMLDWPSTDRTRPTLGVASTGNVIDRPLEHAPGAEPDPELTEADAAVEAAEHLGRTVHVERVPDDATSTGLASRAFRTDFAGGVDAPPATVLAASAIDVEAPADLIVASLPPHLSVHLSTDHADHSADLVALYAARRLRVGGILVVLTHCDWTSGELADPTGAVVTAGQNADLLYLQHIVALHTPVRDGQFHLADSDTGTGTGSGTGDQSGGVHGDRPTGDSDPRARHRASVRRLPAPHRRIHSDVLVFAQPHDHQPARAASPSTPTRAGALR